MFFILPLSSSDRRRLRQLLFFIIEFESPSALLSLASFELLGGHLSIAIEVLSLLGSEAYRSHESHPE